jgi:hypothetical protein
MTERRALPGSTCVLAALLVAAGPARAAAYRPELVFQAGRTFLVGSPTKDAYDQGGFQVTAGALWTWENRFRFGAELFASDFGDVVRQVTLADPGGGPPKVYGSTDQGHLGARGARWRVDALGPRIGRLGRGYATGTFGYFRILRDRVGRQAGALSAVGGSTGIGLERALTPHHALGIGINRTLMTDGFTRQYGSAAIEWRWRW